MMERLVDVLNGVGIALHTFPVLIEDSDSPTEDDFKEKALKLAAKAKLVRKHDVKTMTARMHVSRPGPATPIGDSRHILSGTKQGFEKVVGVRAYFIWQHDGCPDGRAEEHWYHAVNQHIRERAYFLWQQEGCPEGRADEHWRESVEFETY